MDKKSYKYRVQQEYKKKTDELLKTMPDFCKTYFLGRENRLSEVTAASYAYNLHTFFNYLADNNSYFRDKSDVVSINEGNVVRIFHYALDDLEKIESTDIDEFLHYLLMNGNSKNTLSHYISAISALYKFFIKRKMLSLNPIDGVEREVVKKKKIIRLEGNEANELMNAVSYGTGLTQKQLQFHNKNRERDEAIYTLFLDTGIRISELVGLDLKDINFDEHYIGIIRKGGNYQKVYMSDTCEQVLSDYLDIRESRYKPGDDENAVFLSIQGSRITSRAIQNMTKKYAEVSLPNKPDRITPHKLRATYATDMLNKTGDIKLVSEILGHSHVNTTEHYADYGDDKHKSVRNL